MSLWRCRRTLGGLSVLGGCSARACAHSRRLRQVAQPLRSPRPRRPPPKTPTPQLHRRGRRAPATPAWTRPRQGHLNARARGVRPRGRPLPDRARRRLRRTRGWPRPTGAPSTPSRPARSRPSPPATASRETQRRAGLDRRGRRSARGRGARQRGDARARPRRRSQAEANDLPIELNDAVLSCIDLYQGRLRDWFAGRARPRRALPAPDPRGLRLRGHPPGPRLPRPGGERLPARAPTRGPRPRGSGSSSPTRASATASSRTGGWTSAATPRRRRARPHAT